MDPLTALSVAGNVVQFVEFSSKLISASYELYTKSELDCHAQAALATDDILDYTVQLRRTLRVPGESAKLTKEELLLEDICKGCDDLAKDLLARLDKLKAGKNEKGQKMLWPTLTAAFQSLWTQKELLKIQDRLKDYRAQIDSRVMHSLSKLANLKFHELSERFDHLDATNKELASAIVNRNGYDDRGLQEQVSAVSALLDRAEVVMNCHEESTKRVIVDVFQQLGLVANNQEDTQLLAEIRSTDQEVQGLVRAELLDSLHFPTIAERFEAVEEAHTTTFDWVFRRVEDTKQYAEGRRWGDFSDWLQSGNGLYWINGKAGSGKSTLMKYLVNHGKTSSLLRRWARGSKLCTAAFFFWNSGSKQQRTQAGLLRSLLHRILGQHSELIPMVLPTQWTARYAARCLDAHYHDESWELSELETAFKTLITQTSVPLKLCLFIDGLDEYEGNDEDIASLFGRTLMSHNVKICCSSRPHQVFADAFASRPGLRLQDLTIPDMKKYVHDRLERHSRMQQLFKDEPMPSRKLIDEIGTAASGVFLWVRLVVSSLLNGLGAHDDILFLRKRLEEYPKELDEFFHQMIFKVDKVYQQERARLFQLVGATFRDREDEFTSWREIRQLSVLLISFASERNTALVLEAKPGFITKEAITTRCRRMEVLLRTRSGGLLEVQYGKHTHVAPDMGVSYLHRTVKDYLQLWETRQKLADETTNHQHDTFKATETIFKAHILALKARKAMTTTAQPPWTLIQDAITWAQRAERDTHTSQIEYLDEFYNTAQQLWQNSHSLQGAFFEQQKSMLTLATQCGLQHYLDAKLSQENVVSSWGLGRHRRSLLDYALVPDDATETFISEGMVSTLLKYGADPNRLERPFGTSPWQNALSHLNLTISEIGVGKQQDPKRQSYILHQWAPVIKLLLDSGADPYIESPVLVGHVEIGEDKFSGGIVWPPGKILDKAFATEPQILAELREALEKAKLASSRSKISESEEESDVPLPQTESSMSEPQEDLKPLKSPKPSETSVVEAEMVISQLEVKTMETEKGLGAQYDRRPTTRQKESRTKSRQQQLETSEPNRKKSPPCCVIL